METWVTTERLGDRGPEQGIPEAQSVLQSLHKHSYTQLRLKRWARRKGLGSNSAPTT